MHMYTNVDPGNKYYETTWRKDPHYQGGFLLDAGVHFAAMLRMILGVPIASVAAYSRLNKEILVPIDTLHAAVRLADGTTGTFCAAFSSTQACKNFSIVGEKGYVTIEMVPGSWKVTVTENDKLEEKQFSFEGDNFNRDTDSCYCYY